MRLMDQFAYDAFHWFEWTDGTAFMETTAKSEHKANGGIYV